MEEADGILIGVIQVELEDGRSFLAAKGLQVAPPTVHGPDRLGCWILSMAIGGTVDSNAPAELLVEIDPARVGWHVEATASIYPEGADHGDDIDVGRVRVTEPEDPDYWARVLVRRAYVTLWEELTKPAGDIGAR